MGDYHARRLGADVLSMPDSHYAGHVGWRQLMYPNVLLGSICVLECVGPWLTCGSPMH